MGMRYFTEKEVRVSLPVKDAIERLREAFGDFARGLAQNQPRRRLTLENGSVLHTLAGSWRNYFGTKVYTTHPKHGAWFTVLLFDADTGRPLAQFEANWLGQIRTGAASALAADLLAPRRPLTVGCIGAGFQARSQLEALAAVRQLNSIQIASRTLDKRQSLAQEITELLGVPARSAESANEAVESADVVITATWAKDPVFEAAALPPDCLVLAMGSNQATRRELPADLVRNSLVVIDDLAACRIEAGDLLMALAEDDWNRVIELKMLTANPAPYADRKGHVVFKSVGLGLEDVAAAALVYERAATLPPSSPEPAQ